MHSFLCCKRVFFRAQIHVSNVLFHLYSFELICICRRFSFDFRICCLMSNAHLEVPTDNQSIIV